MLLTVGLSAFVSELWKSCSQGLLQHHLTPLCWSSPPNPPGCRGPIPAAPQPGLTHPSPPLSALGYTCKGVLGVEWSKTPKDTGETLLKPPGDAAGVLVADNQLWSPSEAEGWQQLLLWALLNWAG